MKIIINGNEFKYQGKSFFLQKPCYQCWMTFNSKSIIDTLNETGIKFKTREANYKYRNNDSFRPQPTFLLIIFKNSKEETKALFHFGEP